MSSSKFIIGGIFVVAALVSIVPLFKKDFEGFSFHSQAQTPVNKVSSIMSTTAQVDTIGTYNGISVKRSELSSQEKQSLFDAETQLYKAEESILARKYFTSLIEKYAKDKNISDKNLAQQQFLQDNVKVNDSDVKAFIQKNSDNPQLKGKTNTEQMTLVKPYLFEQAVSNLFRNLVAKAKADGSIEVTGVKLPESPRINIEVGNSPIKGSAKAPITIVEFADFQCPYCNTALPTIKAVLNKYKDKVSLVFKSYPLVQLHPQAVNASIAAECAQNQGKFWEMHDLLFENHNKLTDEIYKNLAKSVGLNVSKFNTCYSDASIKAKVMADAEYGQSLGINATPAFYINGILLMGAQPLSEFETVIDKELAALAK